MKILISVGINYYRDGSIKPLRGAARDAALFAGFCEDRLDFDEVIILTDEDFNDNGEDVLHTLRNVARNLKHGDLFVFFFAGHGISISSEQSKKQQEFLLKNSIRVRGENGDRFTNTLKLEDLIDVTQQQEGVQRLFIFDACRIPLDAEDARDGKSIQRYLDDDIYRDVAKRAATQTASSSPLTILNACADQQRAVESKLKRRGLFALSLQRYITERLQKGELIQFDEHFSTMIDPYMNQMAVAYGIDRDRQQPSFTGPAFCLLDPKVQKHDRIDYHPPVRNGVSRSAAIASPSLFASTKQTDWILAIAIIVGAFVLAGAILFSKTTPTSSLTPKDNLAGTVAPDTIRVEPQSRQPVMPSPHGNDIKSIPPTASLAPQVTGDPKPNEVAVEPAKPPASRKPGEATSEKKPFGNYTRGTETKEKLGCPGFISYRDTYNNRAKVEVCTSLEKKAQKEATYITEHKNTEIGKAKGWANFDEIKVGECNCQGDTCTVVTTYFNRAAICSSHY